MHPLLLRSFSLTYVLQAKVRARLEQKLLARKKGFAFNFQVGGQDVEPTAAGDVHEGMPFRFGFNPAQEADATAAAMEAPIPAVYGGGTNNQSLRKSVEQRNRGTECEDWILEPISRPTKSKNSKKKNRSNRKGARGGRKGKVQPQRKTDNALLEGDNVITIRLPVVEDGVRCPTVVATATPTPPRGNTLAAESINHSTSSHNPHRMPQGVISELEAPEETAHRAATEGTVSVCDQEVGSLTSTALCSSSSQRVPPGLTLESWKDPALTDEERRRRRFGRGVRNMAAIQRSQNARREGRAVVGRAPCGESLPHSAIERPHRHGVEMGNLDMMERCRENNGVGGGSVEADGPVGGGSSVFAFGFDIGISFNGS